MFIDGFETNTAVHQGNNLSPLLFASFLNDLVNKIVDLNVGIDVYGRNVTTVLYAYDMVLLSDNEEHLQIMLNTLVDWGQKGVF